MNAQEMVGLCRTSDSAIAKRWADICREAEVREKQWIANLRAQGIKAAHPNDGWVNREKNELQFVYPQFNDGAGVGDIVAIGWPFYPKEVRIVRLVSVREGLFGNRYYKFEDVHNPQNGVRDAE